MNQPPPFYPEKPLPEVVKDTEKMLIDITPAAFKHIAEELTQVQPMQFTAMLAALLQAQNREMASQTNLQWLATHITTHDNFLKLPVAERLVAIISCENIAQLLKEQPQSPHEQSRQSEEKVTPPRRSSEGSPIGSPTSNPQTKVPHGPKPQGTFGKRASGGQK